MRSSQHQQHERERERERCCCSWCTWIVKATRGVSSRLSRACRCCRPGCCCCCWCKTRATQQRQPLLTSPDNWRLRQVRRARVALVARTRGARAFPGARVLARLADSGLIRRWLRDLWTERAGASASFMSLLLLVCCNLLPSARARANCASGAIRAGACCYLASARRLHATGASGRARANGHGARRLCASATFARRSPHSIEHVKWTRRPPMRRYVSRDVSARASDT